MKTIVMNPEDFDKLIEVCENPPPTPALKKLMSEARVKHERILVDIVADVLYTRTMDNREEAELLAREILERLRNSGDLIWLS